MSRSGIATLAVLAAVAAGCGGGTGSTSASTCLEKAGVTVKENTVTESFRSTGVEHALVATLPNSHRALLLFSKNGILAHEAEQQLTQLVEQLSGQASGNLPVRRKGNVLVSWLTSSTAADDELIDRCL